MLAWRSVVISSASRSKRASTLGLRQCSGARIFTAQGRFSTRSLPLIGGTAVRIRALPAGSYDELIDQPGGDRRLRARHRSTAGAAPSRRMRSAGRHRRRPASACARDLARVCQWQLDLFGGAQAVAHRSPATCSRSPPSAIGYGGLRASRQRQVAPVARRDDLAARQAPRRHRATPTCNFLGPREPRVLPQPGTSSGIQHGLHAEYDLARENCSRASCGRSKGITSYSRRPPWRSPAKRHYGSRPSVISASSRAPASPRSCAARVARVQSVAESSSTPWIKYLPPGRELRRTPSSATTPRARWSRCALDLTLRRRRPRDARRPHARALAAPRPRPAPGVPEDGVAATGASSSPTAVPRRILRALRRRRRRPAARRPPPRSSASTLRPRPAAGTERSSGGKPPATRTPRERCCARRDASADARSEPRLAHVLPRRARRARGPRRRATRSSRWIAWASRRTPSSARAARVAGCRRSASARFRRDALHDHAGPRRRAGERVLALRSLNAWRCAAGGTPATGWLGAVGSA